MARLLLRRICVCNWHSERLQWDGGRRDRQPGALINTSEETGQARDTSTFVTFNALNSTNSPLILDSLFMLFDRHERDKKESSNVRLGSKL